MYRNRKTKIILKYFILSIFTYIFASMKRTMIINQKNEAKIAKSFALIKFACKAALIEYAQYLDVDFRSPTIHNKLKRSEADVSDVFNHIENRWLKPDENVSDQVESVEFKTHELLRGIMRLDESELDRIIQSVNSIIENRDDITDSAVTKNHN